MSKKSRKAEAHGAARPAYPLRVRLNWLLAFLLPVIPLVALIRIAGRPVADWATFNESRFVEIRKALPARGMAGYVTDLSGDRDLGAMYIAQYNLAPLILVPGSDYQPVVGNFDAPGNVPEIARKYGLHVVRDFGRGVLLLAKDSR